MHTVPLALTCLLSNQKPSAMLILCGVRLTGPHFEGKYKPKLGRANVQADSISRQLTDGETVHRDN